MTKFIEPLAGGALIGLAVTIMLLFNGRVTGVSGIIGNFIQGLMKKESLWNVTFIGGLITGGFALRVMNPAVLENTTGRGLGAVILAGLLVGYGTSMGNGCTSGHGVCGISRLSFRSIVATLVFILFGVFTVFAGRLLVGE